MKKAVLFDMDGVLIDSEVVMLHAAMEGFQPFGIDATPEDFAPYVGAGENAYLGNVARKYGVAYTPEVRDHVYDVYGEKINRSYTCPRAGEIIAALTEQGIPFAICSSADKVKIHHNLRALGIPETAFPAIVSGEDVTKNKPEPEIYEKGAAILGVKPEECIVVEDTLNGIRAGKSSGATTVAVGTSLNLTDFIAGGNADYYIPNLPGLIRILRQNGLDTGLTDHRVLLEAHRGVGTEAVENTMAAFRLAKAQGYDMIEMDTKYTADHHCVLLHDRTLNRTADQLQNDKDAAPVQIAGQTLDAVNGAYTFGGERIATLEEVLAFAAEERIALKFDNVWRSHLPEERQNFLATIAASPAKEWCGITASDLASIEETQAVLHDCPIHYDGPVSEAILDELQTLVARENLTVWLRFDNAITAWCKNPPVDSALAALVHRYGKLGVWLLTTEEELYTAVKTYGADVIETDGRLKPTHTWTGGSI
ncbi:MAG: HAD-IA family hydrolase [Clostridiales bacterium]|nr:HAD-IA family hydrolase [Clostridiales bacterium]